MLRRSPLKRGKAALKATAPLRRYVGLAQVGRVRREAAEAAGRPVQPALATRSRPAVPDDVRAVLIERSGGWCEIALPGCLGRGTEPSHRITVKAGGRKGAAAKLHNRPSNALWSCRRCHDWCHASPQLAYEDGLMLREHHDPRQEPVVRRGELVYLCDDGRVLASEEVGP